MSDTAFHRAELYLLHLRFKLGGFAARRLLRRLDRVRFARRREGDDLATVCGRQFVRRGSGRVLFGF